MTSIPAAARVVIAAYQDHIGRTPGPDEVLSWLAWAAERCALDQDIVAAISRSPESRQAFAVAPTPAPAWRRLAARFGGLRRRRMADCLAWTVHVAGRSREEAAQGAQTAVQPLLAAAQAEVRRTLAEQAASEQAARALLATAMTTLQRSSDRELRSSLERTTRDLHGQLGEVRTAAKVLRDEMAAVAQDGADRSERLRTDLVTLVESTAAAARDAVRQQALAAATLADRLGSTEQRLAGLQAVSTSRLDALGAALTRTERADAERAAALAARLDAGAGRIDALGAALALAERNDAERAAALAARLDAGAGRIDALGTALALAERNDAERAAALAARVDGLDAAVRTAEARSGQLAAALDDASRAHAGLLARTDATLSALDARIAAINGTVNTAHVALAADLGGLRHQLAEARQAADAGLGSLRATLAEAAGRLAHTEAQARELRHTALAGLDALRGVVASLETRQAADARELELAVHERPAQRSEAADPIDLVALAERVAALEETPSQTAVPRASEDPDHERIHQLYAALEDRFRGAENDVRARVRVYAPYIAQARAASGRLLAADLGCGRGELLSVMAEGGPAIGVDANPLFIERCRERGLEVEHGDAIAWLDRQEAGSLAAISALHLVEHLPFTVLWRLLLAARRALAPGGILMLETPHAGNLRVSATTFWLDPTHLRILPPMLLEFLVSEAGLTMRETLSLHPDGAALDTGHGDGPARDRLNSALHGPQDVAIIATRV
jgi:SAM-dependent methyltransferase